MRLTSAPTHTFSVPLNTAPLTAKKGAQGDVVSAIQTASTRTGVDFSYLLKQAEIESGLNPTAKANTSSASGLYQFIQSTWLNLAERYGEKYGLSGGRAELLAARSDPQMASYMAAELAQENKSALEETWGGEVGATELYLAHFLGSNGASKFLNAKDANADTNAAALLPAAAKANRSIFYKDGQACSVQEVYQRFAAKFEGISGVQMAPQTAPTFLAQIPFLQDLDIQSYTQNAQEEISVTPWAALPGQIGKIASFTQTPKQAVLNPVSIMLMAQLDAPGMQSKTL